MFNQSVVNSLKPSTLYPFVLTKLATAIIDAQGLEVTTDSPEAIRAIDQFAYQLLGYGNNLAAIGQAIESDATAVLANAHVAAPNLSAETADAPAKAVTYLKTAQVNFAIAFEKSF